MTTPHPRSACALPVAADMLPFATGPLPLVAGMLPIVAVWLAVAGALLLLPQALRAAEPQRIPVAQLDAAAKIDGDLEEWGRNGWIKIPLTAALERDERAKYGLAPEGDRNHTGALTLQLKAGVVDGRFYLAVRYPDARADTEHRIWRLVGERYSEGREREDMFALRWHLAGDFDRTMLGENDYAVDVWLWSAARTNPAGVAEDMVHRMTTRMVDGAAEYALPGGKTVYIRKQRDAGDAPYKMLPRPRKPAGERLPSFAIAVPSGSAADVAAKGQWKAGHWQIEFSRALATGNADDAVLVAGQTILGQLAVFNMGYSEHKSVSEPLLFDFSAIK